MRKGALLAGLIVLLVGPLITAWIHGTYYAWKLHAITIQTPGVVPNIDFYFIYFVFTPFFWKWTFWILPAALILFYIGLKKKECLSGSYKRSS